MSGPRMNKSGEEKDFRHWYGKHAKERNLDPDPYAKEHHYNYKAAYRKKQGPDKEGHWPSENKTEGHPNRYLKINGQMTDTKTGRKVK